MRTDDITIIPACYQAMMRRLFDTATQDLKDGSRLPSLYFLGSSTTGALESIVIDTATPQSKEESAQTARRMAVLLQADFVVMMAEAWALPASKLKVADAILDKYGSISAYPGKLDIAWFQLETHSAWYNATAAILPVPPSKKRRKLGPVSWVKATGAEGRLAGILPAVTVH